MRFVFYLSWIVFAAAGGFLTQISTDGVVRFMTDFHGFASAGVSLTDFADFSAAVGVHGFLRNLSCLLIFVLICAIMCYLCLLLSWPWCGIFGGIVEISYFCTSKANKLWKKVSEMSELVPCVRRWRVAYWCWMEALAR